MPSMRSIGRTDSRMMASAFSTSRMRSADMRASGVSMLCASFIRRSASASISARTRIAIELDLVGVGVGLGLGADRRAAVGAGVLLGAAPRW